MSKFDTGNAKIQVLNYVDNIFQLNSAITFCSANGLYQRIPDLVHRLEIQLSPYADQKYKDEIAKIMGEKPPEGRTIGEIRAHNAVLAERQVDLKHCALMALMRRKGFLPHATSGNDVDIDLTSGVVIDE